MSQLFSLKAHISKYKHQLANIESLENELIEPRESLNRWYVAMIPNYERPMHQSEPDSPVFLVLEPQLFL